ncbi:MAG: hypothetical protein EPN88_08515 [Bacteroidetes bacterium]|nr:MAG: hypothetical protein EPN88_08515 [Bacteroidota bacterium]
MKKLFISISVLFAFTFCKGPGSGPLVKDSFNKEGQSQGQVQGQVMNKSMDGKTHVGQVTVEKMNVTVESCDGCVTIAKLLENKKSYSGKVIKIKGKVTKYNPSIMGKNWVHIQDGSEFEGAFDLTITTDGQVAVGETVTFEGKIVLEKDFGYGYSYNILMEEAKPVR